MPAREFQGGTQLAILITEKDHGEGKVKIQEDRWTERAPRRDLVQCTGQDCAWVRGEMASSSSAAGGKVVWMAGVTGDSAGSDGRSACQGFIPQTAVFSASSQPFSGSSWFTAILRRVSEQPREEWKGIQQPSQGGNDCFTLRSPLREEGPEVGTSEQEEGPATSPASIPKHFMVQL